MTRRRQPATKIVYGKTGISIKRRGLHVCRVQNERELMAFLRGYDPQLAARMERAPEIEARIQRLLAEDDAAAAELASRRSMSAV